MSTHRLDVYLHDQTKNTNASVPTEKQKTNKTKVEDNNILGVSDFTKLAGATVAVGSLANGIVGDYTENRLVERRTQFGLKMIGYSLAFATGNPLIIGGAIANIAVQETKRRIKVNKENVKSRYLYNLSGNTTQSGSRWRNRR